MCQFLIFFSHDRIIPSKSEGTLPSKSEGILPSKTEGFARRTAGSFSKSTRTINAVSKTAGLSPAFPGLLLRIPVSASRRNSAIITRVSLQVAGRQAEGYTISTEVYAGPLDLLLDLIEHSELDITRLALAQVTDQYLAYLHNLENNNAAEVSAFLVIAARLVQIKSAALLPRPSLDFTGPTPEDDAEALARQLILYKRFKEIAQFLDRQDLAGLHSYLRIAPPPKSDVPVHLDLSGVSVQDLIQAARDVFHSQRQLAPLSQVVSMPRVTIREKISNLIETLRQFGKATFRSILTPGSTRVDVVVTFLAMLELIKRHLVEAQQDTLFGDISIQSQGDMQEELDSELEFTE